ncbi:ADP-ribosylation factor-like protein 15 [Lamellibrachia satsuma]|nr:ADP-ribosylation factor-like protein 15 [Lamellibrachia satsuma]
MSRFIENIQLACAVCRIGIYTVFCRLCCKQAPPRPDFPAICIGLTQAGKTTLLCLLAGESTQDIEPTTGESTQDIEPTTGFLIKAVQFKQCILNIKEIGGGEKTRQFWKHYYSAAKAVIFVIDSACSESEWRTTQQLFYEAAHNDTLRPLPWLVLANCQDKVNARDEKQICDELHLESVLMDRKWTLQLCSTSQMNDVQSGFERLNMFIMQPDDANKTQSNAATQQTSPTMTRL